VSPTRTAWLALAIFWRLMRTAPEVTTAWACVRLFASLANHSHLSMRVRCAAASIGIVSRPAPCPPAALSARRARRMANSDRPRPTACHSSSVQSRSGTARCVVRGEGGALLSRDPRRHRRKDGRGGVDHGRGAGRRARGPGRAHGARSNGPAVVRRASVPRALPSSAARLQPPRSFRLRSGDGARCLRPFGACGPALVALVSRTTVGTGAVAAAARSPDLDILGFGRRSRHLRRRLGRGGDVRGRGRGFLGCCLWGCCLWGYGLVGERSGLGFRDRFCWHLLGICSFCGGAAGAAATSAAAGVSGAGACGRGLRSTR
jgi:hypothetical protein